MPSKSKGKPRAKPADAPANPPGRPVIPIDWEEFDKLAWMQATLTEIAWWFRCSEDTIERAVERERGMGFAEYSRKKAAGGRISLRRKQYEIAESGNVTMLIWLGKQYLGQRDKHDVNAQVTEHFIVTTSKGVQTVMGAKVDGQKPDGTVK